MFRQAMFVMALALAHASLEANWLLYKTTYNKIYDQHEDAARRLIWQTNLQKIVQHNELYAQGLSSFYMGENQFTDKTIDEVMGVMCGLKVTRQVKPGNNQTVIYKNSLPSEVDWRKKGAVTPVKDMQFCASAYAFAATGAVEGQHFLATKELVSLSESNLVDCSKTFHNNGCNGGYVDHAFQYIIHNKGIDTEQSYPYSGKEDTCSFNRENVGATISSIVDLEPGNEDALQKAVAEIGPISAGINVQESLFRYTGGVYDEPACNSLRINFDVLVVGYGSQDGLDYWIVKNSINTTWGEEGYILMSRNKNNQCGIASAASYPLV